MRHGEASANQFGLGSPTENGLASSRSKASANRVVRRGVQTDNAAGRPEVKACRGENSHESPQPPGAWWLLANPKLGFFRDAMSSSSVFAEVGMWDDPTCRIPFRLGLGRAVD